MNKRGFFERCKQMAGDKSDREWDADDLAGFLQEFRMRRPELSQLFADIPLGLEVCQRVFNIFDAMPDYAKAEAADNDCVVRESEAAQLSDLTAAATKLLENWRAIAAHQQEQALVDLLTPIPKITVSAAPAPDIYPIDYDSIDAYIYEIQSDWQCDLKPTSPHANWMHEAFYHLNCDYNLAYYAMWPWYTESCQLIDPYLSYFQLWQHGAELRCKSSADVTLYVPSEISKSE